MKTLYTLSTCMFIATILFLGGMYVGTKIVSRLNDDELIELADGFESELAIIRDKYRKQIELFERANQYLKDSIVERIAENKQDRERVKYLESTVEQIQIAARESLNEVGNIGKTIQRIKESTDGIGKDIRGLRSEVQRIQEGNRSENWWFSTGEYNPEDQWRSLIDRLNRDFLYSNFQIK